LRRGEPGLVVGDAGRAEGGGVHPVHQTVKRRIAGRRGPGHVRGVPGDLTGGQVTVGGSAGQPEGVGELQPGAADPRGRRTAVEPGPPLRPPQGDEEDDEAAREGQQRPARARGHGHRCDPAARRRRGGVSRGRRRPEAGRRLRRGRLGAWRRDILLHRERPLVRLGQRLEGLPPDVVEQHLRPGERVAGRHRTAVGRRVEPDHHPGRQTHQPPEHGERRRELLRRAPLPAGPARPEQEEHQIRVRVPARRVGRQPVVLPEELLHRRRPVVRCPVALRQLPGQPPQLPRHPPAHL
jgi:hypothetical protein